MFICALLCLILCSVAVFCTICYATLCDTMWQGVSSVWLPLTASPYFNRGASVGAVDAVHPSPPMHNIYHVLLLTLQDKYVLILPEYALFGSSTALPAKLSCPRPQLEIPGQSWDLIPQPHTHFMLFLLYTPDPAHMELVG